MKRSCDIVVPFDALGDYFIQLRFCGQAHDYFFFLSFEALLANRNMPMYLLRMNEAEKHAKPTKEKKAANHEIRISEKEQVRQTGGGTKTKSYRKSNIWHEDLSLCRSKPILIPIWKQTIEFNTKFVRPLGDTILSFISIR